MVTLLQGWQLSAAIEVTPLMVLVYGDLRLGWVVIQRLLGSLIVHFLE